MSSKFRFPAFVPQGGGLGFSSYGLVATCLSRSGWFQLQSEGPTEPCSGGVIPFPFCREEQEERERQRERERERGKTEEWDRILAGGPEEHRAGTPDVNKAQQTPFFRRAVAQQTPPFSFCWASGSSCDLPNHPLCYGVAGFGSSAERHKLRGQALN